MKKRMLFAVAAIGLVLTTACGKKEETPNTDVNGGTNEPVVSEPSANTNTNVIAEQDFEGLKINNVSLITEGETSVFTADVVNTTSENIEVKSFDIIMKDANGNEVITLLGYIGNTIAPNNSSTITSSVEMDLSNVVTVEYVRNY